MYIKHKSEVVKKHHTGIVSHILLSKSDIDSSNLLLTWVEVEPGYSQQLHHHESEQAYIIIQGEGTMTVGSEDKVVSHGDVVYIPSNEMHGLKNTGKSLLVYISASTPSFDISKFYKGSITDSSLK